MLLIIFFCYSLKGNCWLVTQMVFLTRMSVLTCFLTSLVVAADELMSRKIPSSQTLKKRNSNFLNILFAFFTLWSHSATDFLLRIMFVSYSEKDFVSSCGKHFFLGLNGVSLRIKWRNTLWTLLSRMMCLSSQRAKLLWARYEVIFFGSLNKVEMEGSNMKKFF